MIDQTIDCRVIEGITPEEAGSYILLLNKTKKIVKKKYKHLATLHAEVTESVKDLVATGLLVVSEKESEFIDGMIISFLNELPLGQRNNEICIHLEQFRCKVGGK